jgi:transglutaminase-like putative cysteine protease
MPRFNIHHITKYLYEVPVRDSTNQIMLYPLKDEFQEVLRHELVITSEPIVNAYHDYYGNEVGCFMHTEPHTELIIDSRLDVITKTRSLPEDDKPVIEQWDQLDKLASTVPFIDFLREPPFESSNGIEAVIKEFQSRNFTPLAATREMTKYVFQNFNYIQGITTVETTIEEILELKAGVCQDFAHLLSAMLRRINIPSRYVSGYICPNKNGMRGEGATHAWVEAYLPFYGWLGFDPTNNCMATDMYVRLAVGRNFNDCTPVKGTYKGTSNQVLEVGVTVSYQDSAFTRDQPVFLKPQPEPTPINNSYRRFVEKQQELQRQQQQQQQQ